MNLPYHFHEYPSAPLATRSSASCSPWQPPHSAPCSHSASVHSSVLHTSFAAASSWQPHGFDWEAAPGHSLATARFWPRNRCYGAARSWWWLPRAPSRATYASFAAGVGHCFVIPCPIELGCQGAYLLWLHNYYPMQRHNKLMWWRHNWKSELASVGVAFPIGQWVSVEAHFRDLVKKKSINEHIAVKAVTYNKTNLMLSETFKLLPIHHCLIMLALIIILHKISFESAIIV